MVREVSTIIPGLEINIVSLRDRYILELQRRMELRKNKFEVKRVLFACIPSSSDALARMCDNDENKAENIDLTELGPVVLKELGKARRFTNKPACVDGTVVYTCIGLASCRMIPRIFSHEYEDVSQNIVMGLVGTLCCKMTFPSNRHLVVAIMALANYGDPLSAFVDRKNNCIYHFRRNFRKFLDYCQYRFKSIVMWSDATKDLTLNMCRMFENLSFVKFDAVWNKLKTRSELRDMSMVTKAFGDMTQTNTFILDSKWHMYANGALSVLNITSMDANDVHGMRTDQLLVDAMDWFSLSHRLSLYRKWFCKDASSSS